MNHIRCIPIEAIRLFSLTSLALALSCLIFSPIFAQTTVSPGNEATVVYFIPGIGYTRFPANVSLEQALRDSGAFTGDPHDWSGAYRISGLCSRDDIDVNISQWCAVHGQYDDKGLCWGRDDDGKTIRQVCEKNKDIADHNSIKTERAHNLTGDIRGEAPSAIDDRAGFDYGLAAIVAVVLALISWFALSFGNRAIDSQKNRLEKKGYSGSKWAYEYLIWFFPILVLRRRMNLGWGWGKVAAFLIWAISSSILTQFMIIKAFPALDSFELYAAWVLLYGLLAAVFCVAESKFPDASPIPSAPREFADKTNADPFEIAGREVLSGNVEASLWARALVEGNGNDVATRAAYVKLRVAELQGQPS